MLHSAGDSTHLPDSHLRPKDAVCWMLSSIQHEAHTGGPRVVCVLQQFHEHACAHQVQYKSGNHIMSLATHHDSAFCSSSAAAQRHALEKCD
eukprot:1145191-Pelagomonas_calceolata.AAC.1